MNTICPTCDGNGDIRVPRAAVSVRGSTEVSTGWVTEVCKTCHGEGKLKGFQAPV